MESYSFSRSLNMEFLRNISGEQLIIRIYLLFSLCHLREEGSPPLGNNQILFINYRRRGRNDGCSRAGQHVVWKPAEVKNDTTMKYDFKFSGKAIFRIVRRFFLLFVCGVLIARTCVGVDAAFEGGSFFGAFGDFGSWRLMGILQRIALCYLFAGLIVLCVQVRKE